MVQGTSEKQGYKGRWREMTGTIRGRDSFLDNLKSRLSDTPYEPYQASTDLPERHLADATIDELLEIAHQQAETVTTNMIEIMQADLNAEIAKIIEKAGGGQVMIPDDEQFEEFNIKLDAEKLVQWKKGREFREENIMAAQNSNVSVAVAKFMLAESASVAMETHAGQGRSLHFLPTHYIAIVPQSRILPDLKRAADWFHEHKVDGSTLNIISGPSNSGDIEMELVIGLHGPLEMNYLVVKDL